MSALDPHSSTRIADEAAALMAEVERTLADGDARLRAMGLDPAKVREFGQRLSSAQRREVEDAVRSDLEAIDQAVAEERARMQSAQPATSHAPRKLRRFI